MENTLSHHGIKGQRWGVRRFRNEDGSLTPAGKKRAALSDEQRSKINAAANRTSHAQNIANSGKNLTDNLRKMNSDAAKRKTSPKPDLSQMTDKELRDRINRAMLEQQYTNLCTPPQVSRGRERVDHALEVAGNVMAVTGSALAIAVSIQKLRGAI